MNKKNFWNSRIIDWEHRSYGDAGDTLSIIETIADLFRGHLRKRQDTGLEFAVAERPDTVLELGCGSGILTERMLDRGIRIVIGVDISDHAIERAVGRLKERVEEGRVRLQASAVEKLDFSGFGDVDCLIGLGLVPYLSDEELAKLFMFIAEGNRAFLLDFHPKGASLKNVLHAVYRRLVSFPFYRTFSKSEMVATALKYGVDAEAAVIEGNSFIFHRRADGKPSGDKEFVAR